MTPHKVRLLINTKMATRSLYRRESTMERKDRQRGRGHLDPLEQATESRPPAPKHIKEDSEDQTRLDHEPEVRDPESLSYSDQLKRL